MTKKISKTTLAASPEADAILTEIKPHEVSIVDMPANGEPFVVVKRGGTMQEVKKLTTEQVPRPVMKAILSRLDGVKSSIDQIVDVAKRMPAEEDGSDHAPAALVSLVKSTAAELRTLQSPTSVQVAKRGQAESVLSVQDLVKREESLATIEKANAVSYVMRDQYVSVVQSVSEWLTTYVDGIEHDDAGPSLIPFELNEGVEESASGLEKLAEDFPPEEEEEEPDTEADVEKLHNEILKLKETLKVATVEGKVNKRGSKMAASRLKSLKSVSSGVSSAAEELSKLITELEDDSEKDEGEMTTENLEVVEDVTKNNPPTEIETVETTENVQKNLAGEEVTNSQLMAALTKFATDTNERLDKIEGTVSKVEGDVTKANESADKARAEIEKIHLSRGEARGGESDATTTVTKSAGSPADFSNLLGILKK